MSLDGVNPPTYTASFWNYVNKTGSCWIWLGPRHAAGYGRFSIGRKWNYAHRLAYAQFKGPIPEKVRLHQTCGNKLCVRPDHLEQITPRVPRLERTLECDSLENTEDLLPAVAQVGSPDRPVVQQEVQKAA